MVPTPVGIIPRPEAAITLTGPGGSVNVIALVDSGSDICLVPASVGQVIGFNPTAQTNTFGVSGAASGQIFNAQLTLAGETLNIPLFVAVNEDAPILIGRAGIWNRISSINFYNDQQQTCFGDVQPQSIPFEQPAWMLVAAAAVGGLLAWLFLR